MHRLARWFFNHLVFARRSGMMERKILIFDRNFVRGLKYLNEMERMNLEEGGIGNLEEFINGRSLKRKSL